MYDVLIIGGGPGGYSAAIRAAQLGLRTACVEGAPHLGGTCLNVGCMPSKALLHASEVFEGTKGEFAALGVDCDATLNLAQMMRQKEESVGKLVKGIEFLFRKNKVDWIRGWARFTGPGTVDVRAVDGQVSSLAAKHVVIATGSVPAELPGVQIDRGRIVTSTEALSFTEVPKALTVVGAGVIGLELGSVWRRLGSEVTVLEYQDRILPELDAEIAKAAEKSMRRQGIRFQLGVRVTGASCTSSEVVTMFQGKDGLDETITGEKMLIAVGRKPFTEGLGLDVIGLVTDGRGRIPHDRFRTSVPGVWVIGDVTTGPMLAHKAEDEAISCIETIAGQVDVTDHELIPNVVYTRPEIAAVGRTEEELTAAKVGFRVGRFSFQANSRARINHEIEGLAKVLVDARSDRILGVHIIGPDASELIGEACVAMSMGATSEDVARTSHPHPTRSEALRQACMDVGGWVMQA